MGILAFLWSFSSFKHHLHSLAWKLPNVARNPTLDLFILWGLSL
jgi:hypothetical protein